MGTLFSTIGSLSSMYRTYARFFVISGPGQPAGCSVWCHGAIPVGVKKSDFKVSSMSDNLNPQTADPGIPLVSTKVAKIDSSPFIENIEETEVRRRKENSSLTGHSILAFTKVVK